MLYRIYEWCYNIIYPESKNKFYYLSLIRENDSWSIHGLWPQYSANQYPSFCKKVDFSYNSIKSLVPELKVFWYSNKDRDEQFWEHEWKKHGSCMFDDIDEYEYFNTTLKLYKEALNKNLPNKYYNKNTNRCLIPINLNLNFIN